MAATQGDVVIDIEERPIVKTEVNNSKKKKKSGRQNFHIYFFLLINLSLFPNLQLQAEKVRLYVFKDFLLLPSLKRLNSSLYLLCRRKKQ